MFKHEKLMLDRINEFRTPAEAFEWLLGKGIIDFKRCRVWAMKMFYNSLVEKGIPKMDALTSTAEEYSVSEDSAREAVYRNKDI